MHVELSSNHVHNPIFIAPTVQENERIQFNLAISDQNGLIDSDKINIVIHPRSVKEVENGQTSAKRPLTDASTIKYFTVYGNQ